MDDAHRPSSDDEKAVVIAHDIALELLEAPPEMRSRILDAVRSLVLRPLNPTDS